FDGIFQGIKINGNQIVPGGNNHIVLGLLVQNTIHIDITIISSPSVVHPYLYFAIYQLYYCFKGIGIKIVLQLCIRSVPSVRGRRSYQSPIELLYGIGIIAPIDGNLIGARRNYNIILGILVQDTIIIGISKITSPFIILPKLNFAIHQVYIGNDYIGITCSIKRKIRGSAPIIGTGSDNAP